ncbi:hypothetical protein E1B28_012926 [Marasmius oreades]|uniref:Protein-S-isoprenylcysteine O-methyltransferase n=1 Tax=Marasmius oreades TaxID=181124 RepID=A0A9P7RSP9_9AGAR|nr:uncharacterized protein E1B28_012926 [Marasmius oreades]KAG7088980.1 hypothetical protein E1B28_012926 [Marasmius oreades]
MPSTKAVIASLTPAVQEWIAVFVIKYALPLKIMMYYLVSLNEILHNISLAFPSLPIQPIFPSLHASNAGPGIPLNVLLGGLLSIAGGVVKILCYRALHGFKFEFSTSSELATSGPYSIVRHPAYTGNWMSVIGCAMVHWWILGTRAKALGYAWLIGVGSINISLLMRMDEEDALMRQLFGNQWEKWSKVVKYRLIPGVY